jgi:hypothetical protein
MTKAISSPFCYLNRKSLSITEWEMEKMLLIMKSAVQDAIISMAAEYSTQCCQSEVFGQICQK